MRLAVLAVIALGCGSQASRSAAPAQSAAASRFPATRWAPARPTYLIASHTLVDAQRSLRDLIDLAGVVAGVDPHDVERGVQSTLGVDALHGDPLAAIGVDVQGGWAMFSEDLSPTMVVHLSAPELMTAFLDHQRERGLVTQSVIVDKIEVSSATLLGALTVSWAIAGDWMWIHFALPIAFDNGASWFAQSHGAHAAGWTDSWAWAERTAGAAANVVGYLDLHGALATAVARLPDAVACARLFDPVQRVGLAVSGDGRHVATRLAVEVGSTGWITSQLLPAPSGWDATAARAPVAAQWNLDVAALRPVLAPCLAVAGNPLGAADETGLRAARGVLLGFDPDKTEGSGAIALDVSSPAFLERQLDRIPLRRTLESSRTIAGHKGAVIDIPFGVTVEYVLEQHLALAALGEGIVARLLAPGPARASAPPVFALDLAPPAMSAAAWEIVIDALIERRLSGSPSAAARRVAERLMQWRA
ncbi:MAG TPA: hypothetical protein VFT22_21190, partial [Kofleriaceae bacterium]|nr:hypothetical protein [Kofleriaceae bacterium]